MAKKSPQSQAKQAVKKAIKKNPKGFIIALIAIVLILTIAVMVVYFAFPNIWTEIANKIINKNSNNINPSPSHGENDLTIHFLDVGQGDCIYIQFPDGKDMIIDCGNKSSNYNFQTDTLDYLNNLNADKTIDYLMLTHCDEDHVDNLDLIVEEYQIKNIYMPNVLAAPGTDTVAKKALQDKIDKLDTSMFTDEDTISSICYAEFFIAALTEPNCNVVLNIDLDDSHNTINIIEQTYQLIFYCPTQAAWDEYGLGGAEEKNAISPIGVLTYNGRRIVLTGDSNEKKWSEEAFVNRIGALDCDVLKVGHHGSETSTTSKLLNAISCEYAVISCNYYGNTFGHPRQLTIDRLIAKNMQIYRTDFNGNVVLTIDNNSNLTFVTEKTATKTQLENGLSDDDLTQIKTIKNNVALTQEQKDSQIKAIVGY